jgi:predicted RND superfamily exporter protein
MALIPPLMIVIGVPNCIYLLTKFHQEVKLHGNKVKALSQVIQKIGTAMFLTNFTTAIGFITFSFTNSEKLVEFGFAASFNVMMTFVLSLCLLPIFESFSRPPKKQHLRPWPSMQPTNSTTYNQPPARLAAYLDERKRLLRIYGLIDRIGVQEQDPGTL